MNEELIQTTKREYTSLLNRRRILDAVPLIRQCAHWGDLDSQKLLVNMFLNQAYDMPYEPYTAFEYVRMAALNNDPESMMILGKMFRDAKGTKQDLDKAFYFLKKAAEAGEEDACDDLAGLYIMGFGTRRDLDAADKWLDAAEKAHPGDEIVRKHRRMVENLRRRKAEGDL